MIGRHAGMYDAQYLRSGIRELEEERLQQPQERRLRENASHTCRAQHKAMRVQYWLRVPSCTSCIIATFCVDRGPGLGALFLRQTRTACRACRSEQSNMCHIL